MLITGCAGVSHRSRGSTRIWVRAAELSCGATARRHSLLSLYWLMDIRLIRFLNILMTQLQ